MTSPLAAFFLGIVGLYSNKSQKTSKWDKNISDQLSGACVPPCCSYHILTSSVIHYWKDAPQHGIKRTECISGFMSISDVLKTSENITSGLQHQMFLIYCTLNKTLLTNTMLSLNWSFKKLKVEMVRYANDIFEKRKCLETLRIVSLVM